MFDHKKSSGNWKGGKTGGFGGAKKFSRDDRAPMHKTTCNECGSPCEVPFKPNGRKPVYCSNCFRKDENAHAGGFAKPAYNTSRAGGDDVSKQLKDLNAKVDRILHMLSEIDEDGE